MRSKIYCEYWTVDNEKTSNTRRQPAFKQERSNGYFFCVPTSPKNMDTVLVLYLISNLYK